MIGIGVNITNRGTFGGLVNVVTATAATGVLSSSFTANWNAFSGATYYLLDVSLNSSFSSFVGSYQNFVVIGTNSQVVSGLAASTTYYYRVRAVTDPVMLLDAYSGAAAAYSLRKLRFNYSGSAIQVRRSSDNATQDIGFTASGQLDTSALTTFVGSNNGFVTTWYDQSGNSAHITQSNATSQPQIVNSGSIISVTGTGSSTPAIYFDGSNDFMTRTNFSWINYSMFSVQKALGNVVWQNGFGNGVGLNTSSGSQYSLYERGVADHNFATRTNDLRLITGIRDQSISKLNAYINTSLYTLTTSSANTPSTGFYVGALDGTSLFYNGHQSELVFYTSDQSSNVSNIQSNINTHYGIY